MSQRVCQIVHESATPSCIIGLHMVHGLLIKKSLSWYLECIMLSDVFLVKICYDLLNFIPNLFCDKPHSYFLLVHEFNALKAKSNLNYMHVGRTAQ
jgi:hypothetical protein